MNENQRGSAKASGAAQLTALVDLYLCIVEVRGQLDGLLWADHDIVEPNDVKRWCADPSWYWECFGRRNKSRDHYCKLAVRHISTLRGGMAGRTYNGGCFILGSRFGVTCGFSICNSLKIGRPECGVGYSRIQGSLLTRQPLD